MIPQRTHGVSKKVHKQTVSLKNLLTYLLNDKIVSA